MAEKNAWWVLLLALLIIFLLIGLAVFFGRISGP